MFLGDTFEHHGKDLNLTTLTIRLNQYRVVDDSRLFDSLFCDDSKLKEALMQMHVQKFVVDILQLQRFGSIAAQPAFSNYQKIIKVLGESRNALK